MDADRVDEVAKPVLMPSGQGLVQGVGEISHPAWLIGNKKGYIPGSAGYSRGVSANSRMTMAVHILTWMAFDRRGTDKEIATSQRIATSVNTNPVVIRRCLTELKQAGLVEAMRGRGGGWVLARDPSAITLLDVYRALGEEPIFGMYTTPPDVECYVGHGIEAALTGIYAEATRAMTEALEAKSIRDVLHESLADFPELWESQGFAPARL